QTMASVASVPDNWAHGTKPESRPWHFVDIPRTAATYDASRDCPGHNCIVDALDHYIGVLRDTVQPSAARQEALIFVIHFSGDIDQPLHCATGTLPNGQSDHGGNGVKATYPGVSDPQHKENLHHIWDDDLIA